jgi:Ca-activated chloride channel family protein
MKPVTIAVLATLVLGASADAQKPTAPFRSGVDAVYLDVTVIAADGTIVTGLTKDDFEILDEGVAHDVAIFSDQPSPISVGVLIDASRSMTGDRMKAAVTAAAAMGRALKPQDLWSVAVFNSYVDSLIGWRPYDDSVIPTLEKIRVRANTELFRSVADFAKRMGETPHRRRAMLVITDGADDVVQAQRRSRAGLGGDGAPMLVDYTDRAVKALQTGEVLVYGLGLDWGSGASDASALHVPSLKTLADPTGGAVAVVRTLADVEGAAGALANELRQQYTLGFYPQKAPDGKYRRIVVKTKNPDYRVRTRAGYLAARPKR